VTGGARAWQEVRTAAARAHVEVAQIVAQAQAEQDLYPPTAWSPGGGL
jgi:hypothetical protein